MFGPLTGHENGDVAGFSGDLSEAFPFVSNPFFSSVFPMHLFPFPPPCRPDWDGVRRAPACQLKKGVWRRDKQTRSISSPSGTSELEL